MVHSATRSSFFPTRPALAVFLFLALALWQSGVVLSGGVVASAAQPTHILQQCADGGFGAVAVQCTGAAWTTATLTGSNSHYKPGDSIPYRVAMGSLVINQVYSRTIGFATTINGKHATDFLTSFNRTETTAVPDAASPNNFAIPSDPHVSGAGVTQIAGNFSCYGCTILSTSAYTLFGTYAGTSETRITLQFRANRVDPVLAFGGHLATPADWGVGNTLDAVPGSFYDIHLYTGGVDFQSITARVIETPGISTQRSGASTILPGQAVSDTVTLTGTVGFGPVAGTVQFFLCTSPNATAPNCSTQGSGSPFGSPVPVTTFGTTPPMGTASSGNVITTTNGTYCFRAEYIPAAGAGYNEARHSNTLEAGIGAECFFIANPTAVTISDLNARAGLGWLPLGLGTLGLLGLGSLALLFRRKRAA